jgi:hypothetical protein
MKHGGVVFMAGVVFFVLVLFGLGIYVAARYSFWVDGAPRPGDMPGIVSYFVTAVNGVLAANLGALLGISISIKGLRGPQGTTEVIQWIAAAYYVLMLLMAIIFWGLAGFTDDPLKVVSLLPEMCKSAIGIFIAILAAVLGVQTAATRAKAIAEKASGIV